MTSWKCKNLSCPDREPIQAETAPRCYTCGQSMPEVVTALQQWALDLLTPTRSGEIEEVHEAIVSLQNSIASTYALPESILTQFGWNFMNDHRRRH